MEYEAVFGINCGVSNGFGLKRPDRVSRVERIFADSPELAYQGAMKLASKFAEDYLSDPNTNLTTVRLTSLGGGGETVPFDAEKSVAERSMLQHFLADVFSR